MDNIGFLSVSNPGFQKKAPNVLDMDASFNNNEARRWHSE